MAAHNSIGRVLLRLVIEDNGCWTWTGKRRPDGYGVCMLDKKWVRIHRVVYEHFVGPIPDGKVLHHCCENRLCANFEHLEPCTIAENILKQDPSNFGKGPRNRVNCIYGHSLSGDNLFMTSQGFRMCRTCQRRRKREWRARQREEKNGSCPR